MQARNKPKFVKFQREKQGALRCYLWVENCQDLGHKEFFIDLVTQAPAASVGPSIPSVPQERNSTSTLQ